MTSLVTDSLRRLARSLTPHWSQHHHHHPESHRGEGFALREFVFGANDGLVSNTALVAGIAGGTSDPDIVVLGGIAGMVAGALSMALGAYVSTKSEREFREAEQAREHWEVEHMREQELAETRRIFLLKGITGTLLDEVVEVVSRDHDQWVNLMMREELGFSENPPRPTFSALLMGFSFTVAAFFPVAPWLLLDGAPALWSTFGLSGVALFGVGAWRASLTEGRVLRKGAEMVLLAGVAVAGAFLIGSALGVAI